jgi:hypothetical protein
MRGYDREGGAVKWVDPWYGRPYDPANPFEAFGERGIPAPSKYEPRATEAIESCPARVKAGCGCAGRFECRLREMAVVSPEDCRICLTTREPTRD